MSTRCVVLRGTLVTARRLLPLVLALLIALLTLGTASAQDSTAVIIETVSGVGLSQPVTLDVALASVGPEMAFGGFDLMVSWDPAALTFQSADQGALLDTCGWEYFIYRADSTVCGGAPAMSVCRLVALADINNGPVHPTCYGGFPGQLAALQFMTTANQSNLGQSFPVRFSWCDCGDNVFTTINGDTLWISDRVYEDGVDITDPSQDFPTFQGAPSECPDDSTGRIRRIDYHQGWVEFNGSDTVYPGHAALMIDTISDVGLNQPVSLDITLADVDPSLLYGGFNLLVAWDPSALSLQSVDQGSLLDTCGWESFTYNDESLYFCDSLPGNYGLVQITAIADMYDGGDVPSCHGEFPGVLATMNFLTSASETNLGTLSPVRFYWCYCADNLFSSVGGDTVWISDHVYEFGYDITEPYNGFPTFQGAQVECPNDANRIFRATDYYQGYVNFADQDTVGMGAAVALTIDDSETIHVFDTLQASIFLVQTWPTQELGGFDFLFEHQLQKLRFLRATPGAVLQDCGWEYFQTRSGDSAVCGSGNCPQSVVRVVALADMNDQVEPSCWATDNGALVDLEYEVLDDSAPEWSDNVYLNWIWYDCGDNSLSNREGSQLFVSDNVYDADGFAITADSDFPTYTGAPSACIVDTGSGMVPAQRRFDFHNTSALVAYVPEIDQRGDINFNSISYEVADWVLFSNYFLYGLVVFDVNIEGQIAASDVNANGITLELADLVFLYRVIIGDAMPFEKGGAASGGTVTVLQNPTDHTISIDYDGSLSALQLVASGEIVPSIDLPDHEVSWSYESGQTRILVVPSLQSSVPLPTIGSGLLGSYTGDGQIVSALAAYDGFSGMSATVESSSECCHQRGDVTGEPGGPIDIADLVYLVNYMFQDGAEPDCMAEADIDAQGGLTDIADLIFLVNYMFQSGPAPSPCDY